MKISAIVKNKRQQHEIEVSTDGKSKTINIPVKLTGYGSSVNGAELLLLSLATCYCNDIYREAEKMGITVSAVEVICRGEFAAPGQPGSGFEYNVQVTADASPAQIRELIRQTDEVAEIQNTLRKGVNIRLVQD